MMTTELPLPPHLKPLLEGLELPCKLNEPLGPLTWYGAGGPAELLAAPASIVQLAELLRRCKQFNQPVRILGSGANLLVSDAGVKGVVIQLTAAAFTKIDFIGTRLVAGGGADLFKVVQECARQGLSGLECMAGIPASVGGAVRMNAGGTYGEIRQSLHSILCMDGEGGLIERPAAELGFSYRKSHIPEPIILEARFDLTPIDPAAARARVKEIFDYKSSTQPMGARSAGCAFKNPPKELSQGRGAGKLIDDAGLKGRRVGGAEVSPHHANFIVLHPGGAADDVLELMKIVQSVVLEKFKVPLEREVVVWE